MDAQQPSSGDLRDIQRQHKLEAERNNQSSSSDSSSCNAANSPIKPSLLEIRQSNRLQQQEGMIDEESLGIISPMPTGAERMAALRDLGATFEEGQKPIAKVATPTETTVSSFVDSDNLEQILHQKQKSNLSEVSQKNCSFLKKKSPKSKTLLNPSRLY